MVIWGPMRVIYRVWNADNERDLITFLQVTISVNFCTKPVIHMPPVPSSTKPTSLSEKPFNVFLSDEEKFSRESMTNTPSTFEPRNRIIPFYILFTQKRASEVTFSNLKITQPLLGTIFGEGSILVLTIKHQPEAELAVVNCDATETEVALLDCVQLLQSEMEEEVSLCRLL